MSDVALRLAPRSLAAVADFELLRVARTDLDELESEAAPTLVERIRGFAPFRVPRTSSGGPGGLVRQGRHGA